jgi:tagatose 1,6-diphosphate aldolase
MPFFLEPVGYDVEGRDLKGIDYAKLKPEIVLRTMEELSKDIYHADILKVEFPVNAAYVEGSGVYAGQKGFTREEALEWYRRVDAVARRPYIYLSAGVTATHFREQLRLAAEAGARFSGVLCGRATWQDGIPVYAKQGRQALDNWLSTEGVKNVQAVNECLQAGRSWESWRQD